MIPLDSHSFQSFLVKNVFSKIYFGQKSQFVLVKKYDQTFFQAKDIFLHKNYFLAKCFWPKIQSAKKILRKNDLFGQKMIFSAKKYFVCAKMTFSKKNFRKIKLLLLNITYRLNQVII